VPISATWTRSEFEVFAGAMSFNTVDLTNMMRGEGEWKNMQEVVRRTLKICFDQLEHQGEQVAYLAGQVASLKTQLASKPNRDEIGSLNQPNAPKPSGVSTAPSKDHVTRAEFDRMKERIAHIQTDIERKASVRYVDECLQRKVDKSDVLIKNLATFSAAQYASQLTQLYRDVTDTKASVESLSRATTDMQRNMQGAEEFHVMKNQVEAIYRSMGDYYTKNHMLALLNQKVTVRGDHFVHATRRSSVVSSAEVARLLLIISPVSFL
jgi:regulator of replication initiation timing